MKKIFPDQLVVFWRKGKGMRSMSQIIEKQHVKRYGLLNCLESAS